MKHMIVMFILALLVLVSSVRAEIFRDNFNDGDLQGWTLVQGAEDGGIENGELVLGSPKAESETEVIIVADGIIASDYEVSVSLKISKLARVLSGSAAIGIRAHTDPHHIELLTEYLKRNEGMERNERDERNKGIQLMFKRSYRFFLGNIHDNKHHDIRRGLAATIQLMKVSVTKDGVPTIFLADNLHTFREFDFKLHEWYRLKIIAKGNRFQCFIDDKKMLDFLDDTYTEGGIYLASGKGNRVHFDDFEVQYEALSVQLRRQLTTTWGEIKSNLH